MIKQFCLHQKWTIIESAVMRGKTMVSRLWPKKKSEWANDHSFRVFCKMLLLMPLFPHDILGYYTERVFSKNHQWRLHWEAQSCESFDHLINSVPGYVLDVLHNCGYLQLDASFRAIRPYVYSTPLGIRANESFSSQLYWACRIFRAISIV
jgi:hypothetical protein